MYVIDYYDNKFICKIKSLRGYDDYHIYIEPLKKFYLQYNSSLKVWIIPVNLLEEMILYFSKKLYTYYLTDTALQKLKEIQEQSYKREVIFYRDRFFDTSILNPSIVPYPYQLSSIQWGLQRNAYLDAHAPGLGKTFINICIFSHLYNKGYVDGIIIIVPIGLALHWKYQILEFVNCFTENDIVIVDNNTKISPFTTFKDEKILIIRHDLLADCIASYHKDYNKQKSLKRFQWKRFNVDIKKEWNKKAIFTCVDEAHNFKHSKSIKTKALLFLKKYSDYRALLTATPSINHVEDLYSLLYFLDKSIIKMNENAFRLWISNQIGNRWDKYAIISYNSENVKKLLQSFQHIFLQKLKKDIKELQHIQITNTIECEITPIQKQIYDIVANTTIYTLQQEYDVITYRLFLSQLHLLLEVFDNPLLLKKRQYADETLQRLLSQWSINNDNKIKTLDSLLEEHIENRNEKCIVYDIHPYTLNLLYERYKKYNPQIIHGQLQVKDKEKDRKEKERIFNYDDKCKLLLLSMQTSSQGINLQYGGHIIIFNTLSWDATLLEQARNRTDRINSMYDTIIYMLYYPKTIDEIRLKRNLSRISFNEKMNQPMTEQEIHNLLHGII